MSDEVEIELSGGQIEVAPVYSDDEIDVVEDDTPSLSDSEKALQAELEAKKAELARLNGEAGQGAIFAKAIEGLGQSLNPRQQASPRFQDPGVLDWQAEFAKADELVWQAPAKTMADIASKVFSQQAVAQANAIMGLSKKLVTKDPELAPIMQKYEGEVDAYVASQPPAVRASDPDIYEKAAKYVRAQHVDDIIAMKVQEALAAQAGKQAPRPAQFTETGRPIPASPAVKQKVKISSQAGALVRRTASDMNIPEEAAYRYLKSRNAI